jgi:hypothetical protein
MPESLEMYQHFSSSPIYQTFLIAPLWMPVSKAGKRKLRESLIPWKMRDSGYRRPFCARHAPIQTMRVGLLIRLYNHYWTDTISSAYEQ